MTSSSSACVNGSEGVGAIAVGRPLPKELLTQELSGRYLARYIGDAQPFEGFRFDTPPLVAVLDGGPFSQHVEKEGVVEPDANPHRAAAAKAAQEGAKVRAILVHGPGPATAAGVAVGTSAEALRTAYADLAVHAVPPNAGGSFC